MPERLLDFLLYIGTAQTDVLQRIITQARQLLALVIQRAPALYPLNQGRPPMSGRRTVRRRFQYQDITFPLVQVEVHCEPSKQLLLRQDLDLSIVTREPGTEIGQILRQERFVWMEAQGFCPHERTPLPLAMFNTDCFCRVWACNALDTIQREYRVAYTSASLAAISAVVSAGLAITAQLESLLTPDLRIIGELQGLPLLPSASIVLLRNPNNPSPITECLADYIAEGFKL